MKNTKNESDDVFICFAILFGAVGLGALLLALGLYAYHPFVSGKTQPTNVIWMFLIGGALMLVVSNLAFFKAYFRNRYK